MEEIIKFTNIFILSSTEPFEISMICEKALSLMSQNQHVVVIDCISDAEKPKNFYFAEKYSLYKFQSLKKLLIKNDINLINLPRNPQIMHSHNNQLNALAKKAAHMELIAIKRDLNPCEICHAEQKKQMIDSYIDTYTRFQNLLTEFNVECIYIYNGRFLIGNACWNAASANKLKIRFLEQISMNKPDKFWVFEEPVHSISYRAKVIKNFIKEQFENEYANYFNIGIEWYLNRISGKGQSFTSKQNLEYYRKTPEQCIVSFFTSSEDELILLGLEDPAWGDQKSIIVQLAQLFANLGNINFVIRIHPNTNHKSSTEILKWKKFKKYLENNFSFVEVIDPLSKVNTYSLIKQSNLVVTNGSTVNLEAAFLNIPNVLIGNGLYKDMEIAYTPKDCNEFSLNLTNYMKNDKNNYFYKNAIKTATFLNYGGLPYKFVMVNPQVNDIRLFDSSINNSKIYSLALTFDKTFLKFKAKLSHAPWHKRRSEEFLAQQFNYFTKI